MTVLSNLNTSVTCSASANFACLDVFVDTKPASVFHAVCGFKAIPEKFTRSATKISIAAQLTSWCCFFWSKLI